LSKKNTQIGTLDQSNHSVNITIPVYLGQPPYKQVAASQWIERAYIRRFGKKNLARIRRLYARNMEVRALNLERKAKALGVPYERKVEQFTMRKQLFLGPPSEETQRLFANSRVRKTVRGSRGGWASPLPELTLTTDEYKGTNVISQFSELAAAQLNALNEMIEKGLNRRQREGFKTTQQFKLLDAAKAANAQLYEAIHALGQKGKANRRARKANGIRARGEYDLYDPDCVKVASAAYNSIVGASLAFQRKLKTRMSKADPASPEAHVSADEYARLAWDSLRGSKHLTHMVTCMQPQVDWLYEQDVVATPAPAPTAHENRTK
jgi:hypothetical protein